MEIEKILEELKVRNSNKVAVYTALTNSYDTLYEPKVKSPEIDYYLFSDNLSNAKTSNWNLKEIDIQYRNPRRLAKIFKIFPHYLFPRYEYSIWVDANFEILNNLNDLVNIYLENSDNYISFFNHSKRSCIYDEGKCNISLGYGNKHIILKQINRYKELGYPEQNGLIAGGFIMRKHNDDRCKRLMKKWWGEIDRYSSRDQLSFNYICWKNNYRYNSVNLDLYNNIYFKLFPHPRLKFYNKSGLQKVNLNIIKGMIFHFISSKIIYRKYIRKIYLFIKSLIENALK